MSTPLRPNLAFARLEDLLADAGALAAWPVASGGKWTLAMILDHLARSMNSVFGPDVKPAPWPVRNIVRYFFLQVAHMSKYPTVKIPAPKMIRPGADVNLQTAHAQLRAAVEKLQAYTGDKIAVPIIGEIPFRDFLRLQLLHGAHHLSFVEKIII